MAGTDLLVLSAKVNRVDDLLWCVRSAVGAESGPMWAMWRPLASRGTAAPRGRGTIRERRYRPPLYFRAGKQMNRNLIGEIPLCCINITVY
jgi:hypothetical protein